MSLDKLKLIQISSLHEARRWTRFSNLILLALSVVAVFYSCIACAERVSDRIYSIIQSDHYCSRRLNATHQMGCQSKLGGNLGIVWVVQQQKDLDHILKTGPTPPYTAVLRREYYSRKILLEFKANTDRVSGVIFFDSDHADPSIRAGPLSPEDRCPNRYSGLYVNDTKYENCKQNIWQKESPISGLLYDDIPYPIFLINDRDSIQSIETCFKEHNVEKEGSQSTYPLCGVQLDSFMTAAIDSETCVNAHSFVDELLQTHGRRCDSVDNQNIFAYLKPAYGPMSPVKDSNYYKPATVEPQSIVMLVTKLSSMSMFAELSPGADSTITSIVALLAIADALHKTRSNPDVIKSKRNIAFALLDSEPFDYTGSNRMIYDMQSGGFPNHLFKSDNSNNTDAMLNINLSSIEYLINLDQLSLYPGADSIHLHSASQNSDPAKLSEVFDVMKKLAPEKNVKLEIESAELPLPPAPVQEFIKRSKSLPIDKRLTGVVLGNYGETFNNLYYHSIYDDTYNIYQTSKQNLTDHISRVSSFVAKSMYELTFQADSGKAKVEVDKTLIDQLLDCYLKDASCPLFTKVWQAQQQLPKGPIRTYKDPIKRSDDMNGAITAHLLAYFTGDQAANSNLTKCMEKNEESLIYNYQFVNGKDEPVKDLESGVCIQSQVGLRSALSPAFQWSEYSITINKDYPAWTVSLNGIRNPVRLFLKPSPVYEWGLFLTGIIITVMAFVIINHISRSISNSKQNSDFAPGTST